MKYTVSAGATKNAAENTVQAFGRVTGWIRGFCALTGRFPPITLKRIIVLVGMTI